jgi:pimeloyl-ACP methyl ester carboxylesterase
MRRRLAAAGVAALAAAPLQAEVFPTPSQAGWDRYRGPAYLESGITLSYVTFGDLAAEPVILLHGYTDNSRSWSLVGPWLEGFHVEALDLRGHGSSQVVACCYGLDQLAHDVVLFMDELGLEKAHVVGHSLGAMTAGVLAATYPERVDRLVLISAALSVPEASGQWLWENVPALEHPIDPESQFMLDWYWNPSPVEEDFLARERSESAARPPEVWMGVLTALSMTDWTTLAGRISAPTLIMWGDQDGLFGAETQEALRGALPGARFETFAGHGHNMFWEVPERAGTMIAEFLSE